MFPSTPHHYAELLYAAYKSDNPTQYLIEFLTPYQDILNPHQIGYLIKLFFNRALFKGTPLLHSIEQEEQQRAGGLLLTRFTYYATALCHLWYREGPTAFSYALDVQHSTIVCYQEPNVALPYVWLDVEEDDKQRVNLMRSNVTHLPLLTLETRHWKTTTTTTTTTRKAFTYDLINKEQYEEVGEPSGRHGEYLRLRIDTLQMETGILHEFPFVLIITRDSILHHVLYNTEGGHLLPLLCSLHPMK